MSLQKFVFWLCAVTILYIAVLVNSQVYFPADEVQNESLLSGNERVPIMSNRCATNELLYPGFQDDDWVCDCRPAHLYVPNDDQCYPAYERGPCKVNEYLILPENSFNPECRRNRCPDKSAIFRNRCIRLGQSCDRDTRRRFGVNETTLALECLQPDRGYAQPTFVNRFGEEQEFCFKGCKRYHNKKCSYQQQ